jgi:hypothetical protein
VRDGASLLDCRTLTDEEVEEAARAVSECRLTVGTAGHIDHGKTWLVRALTGKDTDRLPRSRPAGSRSISDTRPSISPTAATSR